MRIPPDRFDEVRRRWIARHQQTYIFQKRRAEVLARQIRDRATALSGARSDPADDDVIHPLLWRGAQTSYARRDLVAIAVVALILPVGWPAGRVLHQMTVRFIPEHIRAYPVAAYMWAAVVTGLPLAVFYESDGSLWGAVVWPWVMAQIPGALLMAGVYGILEGWLAVAGSRDWWPMRPPHEEEAVDFGWGLADLPRPGLFPTTPTPDPGQRMPIHRDSGEGVGDRLRRWMLNRREGRR